MQEFDKQIDAIRAGLAEIVPTRILFTLRCLGLHMHIAATAQTLLCFSPS